jgi:nitroreductase
MNARTSTQAALAREGEIDVFEALLARRHSSRGFLPQPVPRASIERMLAVAGRTASWCNAQPWHVQIVSGAALERLRSDLVARAKSGAKPQPELDWPREYTGVFHDRRRQCGWALYEAVGVARGDREASGRQALENFRLFGAPHLAVLSSPEALGTHGVMDCGAWVANFMLAGTALGVGSIAQAAVASWPDILRAHLPIAADRRVVCGISFGYEDAGHPANAFRTSRAPLAQLVNWVE